MTLESLIIIIREMQNEYERSYTERSKQKYDDLAESIRQIQELSVYGGASFALGKVLELVDEDKKDRKE